jgi:hypothetical protein
MKLKGGSSVQGLLFGDEFSTSADRDYTDETYKRIVGSLGGSDNIKQKVPFSFSKEEKIAIYQDLKARLDDSKSSDEIAKDVLSCMEEHLKDKESEAYGETNPKLKGGKGKFRRVD